MYIGSETILESKFGTRLLLEIYRKHDTYVYSKTKKSTFMWPKYLKFRNIRNIQRSSIFNGHIREVLREIKEVDNYNCCYR